MGRPRKNPDDPKWQTSEPPNYSAWQLYFAAAMTGLIARGGASMDSLIKTARMYADEAVAATEDK
jgi:hypothetical protein